MVPWRRLGLAWGIDEKSKVSMLTSLETSTTRSSLFSPSLSWKVIGKLVIQASISWHLAQTPAHFNKTCWSWIIVWKENTT